MQSELPNILTVHYDGSPKTVFRQSLVKWTGDDRIKEVVASCYTDETSFKNDDLILKLWDEMEYDFCSLVNSKPEYLRAVADLHEVKEDGLPALRHEGRATTADGWQILVIEDIGYYKPKKSRVRIGVIWATHLETDQNIPAGAVQQFERELEAAQG